ncbi:rhamnogalacturonan acetylesterase [Synoicihabitans lomoniglobus]|uniref:Rhamnogalacturonan acetylesterase n=1 Tax=Synoicihabitans lomoniglobus TaxID=2909285 RepID=A0AAE9ZUD8_9BACT|nr:rhamnogalacturonan acetylesterase [Opitutaceae bacterium LMO-M01]WED64272.1 rhamnogalacturonan acetylesterase [Opitutaceae bacterium LMO-M01]
MKTLLIPLLSLLALAAAAESRTFPVTAGNHRVTLTFGAADRATDTTVLAESRQLMLERVRTAPGEFLKRSVVINTRNPALEPPPRFAPGATAVLLNERETGINRWDDQLTLTLLGPAPAAVDVIITPAPDAATIYLLGDSTVTDQPRGDYASWGQMLPRFFDGSVAIANHAESGETMKSFLFENRLNKVLSTLRAGDTVIMQFGHNDQKRNWPQTYLEAHTTWPAYLRAYVAEIKHRGATPVLVTSMERRTFTDDGRIRSTHGDYPQNVRDVAAAEGVALVDLQAVSSTLYTALGPELAPLAFANAGKDATHHNAYGAYQLALAVAHGLRAAAVPVAEHLATDLPEFDPAHPVSPAAFDLPFTTADVAEAPRGN